MAKKLRLRHVPGVAGVDEAGRGPLAGPVYAAAVILPENFRCPGLNDSKQLDKATRERLEKIIKARAIWAVAYATVEEIDRLNILWASMEAMNRALRALPEPAAHALIDGNRLPPRMPCSGEAIIDGDAKVRCIAAASVLAKTARDRYMTELCSRYPEYGFSRHFGYSTPEHKRAIREHGICEIHRRSFWPGREAEQLCLTFVE